MATNCSVGYASATDFDVYNDCRINMATVLLLNWLTLTTSSVAFVAMLACWLALWRRFMAKPPLAKALLAFAPIAVLLFLLRPLIGVINPTLLGTSNIGIAILVNVAMIGAGHTGIAFVYFQARLLERSAFGKNTEKFQSRLSRHARVIFIVVAVVLTVGFSTAVLLGFYAPSMFPPRILYFGSLIFIDMTCIPIFAAICLLIYRRIHKDQSTMRSRHVALGRQILIVAVGCLGSAVGTLVGSIMGCMDVWPFIANIIPLTAVAFFLFMFALIARKPSKIAHSNSSNSPFGGSLNTPTSTLTKEKTSSLGSSVSSSVVVTTHDVHDTTTPVK